VVTPRKVTNISDVAEVRPSPRRLGLARLRAFFTGMNSVNRLVPVAVCLMVLAFVVPTIVWWTASPSSLDAFYESPRQSTTTPGILLRSEPFTRAVPSGAQAWRILYTTTHADNSSAVASAVVMVAAHAPSGPHPVIAWAHGTTGIAAGCAPSLMPNPFANVPAVHRLLGEGWAYVATDNVGIGSASSDAFLVGDAAARMILDAVGAARHLPGLSLDNKVVLWGYSQGGNSALWAGIHGMSYAPNANLLGIAALAPASDLKGLAGITGSTPYGKIVSAYVLAAYSAVYPDVKVEQYVLGSAGLLAKDIAARCAEGWPALVSALETTLLPKDGIFARDPTGGPLGARLAQNTPQGPILAPVFIAQGTADELVQPEIQRRFVAERCAAGQIIDYRLYEGRDHVSLLAPDSPLNTDLINWTRDRLAGRPALAACTENSRDMH
jgi:alpha-beta hydrolase superfamily lysophospholipase